MKALALSILALLAASAAHAAGDYTVLMTGIPKGTLIVTDDADGVRSATLHYEDRGRGPHLVTKTRYDQKGLLTQFDIEGVNYMKRPVTERFVAKDGRASWTGSVDSGETAAGGYYLVSNGNAEDTAALARALLQAPGQELALIPAGRASIRKVTDYTIAAGASSGSATLYFITGLEMQPTPIWLDRDKQLFGSGDAWLNVVRKGYESVMPALVSAQEEALSKAAMAKAGNLRRVPKGALVIRNANVFDAENRRMLPQHSVVVRGDKIEALGPDGTIAVPRGAEVIDAKGMTLMPGMWDMHEHVQGQQNGLLALLAGITTLRDLGNDPDTLSQMTQRFDDGTLAGPWIVKAALIDKRDEFAGPTKFLVSTPQEMRDTVDKVASMGYVQAKFYSALTRELLQAGIDEAHKKGLRVSGHIPAGITMREAVTYGYDEVQHANFWFLNFMSPDIVARTQTPVRFSAPAEHGRDLDLSSAEVRDFIALLKEKGTVVDPTLGIFESMFTDWKGTPSPWIVPWEAGLPPSMAREARSGGRATTEEQRKIYGESFTRMKQMCKMMYEAGIPIVAGTDGSPLQHSRELELYVESGIPAPEVLYITTLGSARVMKMDKQTGSIAPGKRADLVLIEGDPSKTIGDVRRTRMVVKGGALYDVQALALAAGLTKRP